MSDAAMMSGLAGILGIAAVFITPTVVFFGETKAAIGITGMVKGLFSGANPDSAADTLAKHKSNLDYEEEMANMGSGEGSVPYYLKKLGINSAEAAKYQAQIENEINAINRGAAFATSMAQGQTGDYAMGSFANSYSGVEKTVGAGVAVSTMNGGNVTSNIQSLANGSIAMGAKGVASTIGYGQEVHLNDAMVSGLASGVMDGAKDNYIGSNITRADARALGTDSGVQMVTKAEGLIASGNYDENGNLTSLGENKARALMMQTAKNERKLAEYGKDAKLENVLNAGAVEGAKEATVDNDLGSKLTVADGKKLGHLDAAKMTSQVKSADKNHLFNENGDWNNDKFASFLENEKQDLIEQRDKDLQAIRNKMAHTKSMAMVERYQKELEQTQAKYDSKLDNIDKLIQESGNKTIAQAYQEGLIKSGAKDIAKTMSYGGIGTADTSLKAGMYDGIQMSASDMGTVNAVVNDKNGIGDLYQGAERQTRAKVNNTIGIGELQFTDKNGNAISETKAMGFIKAGAAKGFAAQILAGEADLEKAFEPMGANGEKRLTKEMAKGLFRSEEANFGNIAGMANLGVSDDEFYKNIREQSIEKGKIAQAHARKMRGKFGDKLDSNGFDKMVDDYAERDVQLFQGTAKSIHKNLQKNSKIYEQNADYGEESKQQSIDKKIETAGGINEAVKLDVDKSGMDTARLKGNIKSWEKLINNPQSLEKLLNELKSKGMDVSNLEGKTGLDFLEALSSSNALRFYGQNSIVGADGKVFNGAITSDGKISGKITGGLSKVIDNSNKLDNSNVIKNGNFADVPDGFMQRMWDKINKEHPNATQGEKMAMLANEMAKFKKDQSYGNAKNNAVFELGEWGAYAVNTLETLGIASLVEGVTKGKVKLNTDKLQKKGAVLKEDGWYKDDVKVATKEGYAVDPHTGKVMEKGVFGRMWDNIDEKFKELSPFKQRTEETMNSSSNSNNNKGNTEFKENVSHSSTPSDVSSSINENGKNVNASVLTDEEKFKQNLFQSRVDELKAKVAAKKPRKPEKIKLQQELLKELDAGKVDIDKLREFGFTKKELMSDFGEFMKDGKVVSPVGEKLAQHPGAATKALKAGSLFEGAAFAASMFIEGTPLAPTIMGDSDLHLSNFHYLKSPIVTTDDFKDLNNVIQKNQEHLNSFIPSITGIPKSSVTASVVNTPLTQHDVMQSVTSQI